jgi:hypothetical protein
MRNKKRSVKKISNREILLRLDKLEKENKILKQKLIKYERVNKNIEYKPKKVKYSKAKPTKVTIVKEKSNIISTKGDKIKLENYKHKKYLTVRDRKNNIIERKRYNKKTYQEDKKKFLTNGSFKDNIWRSNLTNVRETQIKLTSNGKPLIKKFPKIKDRKYRYTVTAKNSKGEIVVLKNGQRAVASGRTVNSITPVGNKKISDEESYKEAYANLYGKICYAVYGYSDSDKGEEVVDNNDWIIEESVVYYDSY